MSIIGIRGSTLQKALPEGAVDTGGHVDGFLYFQHISEKESGATLQFILVDGKTGQQFGTVNIPFTAYR
jgi:hypothetical protein